MRIAAFALCIFLITTGQAQAYVDPGFGSLLLQILAGMALGAMFYIRKTRDWLARRLGFKTDADDENRKP